MGAGPRREVEAPRASAPRVGLLQSAVRTTQPDSVWENGIAYDPEGCGGVTTPFDPCDQTHTFPDGERPDDTVEWEPYAVWESERCTGIAHDRTRLDRTRERVRRKLTSTEGFQVERELWTGEVATAAAFPNRFLADVSNVDILTEAGAVGLTHGLACLSQYLAENNGGQQGMIHATPQVVTHWAGLDLLRVEGARLLTIARGDVVVPGAGYTGSDPDGLGPEDGDVWAYATDMVEVRLGERIETGADPVQIDRPNNVVDVRASRLALASWQGCRHAGARLDIVTCGIGGS